MNRQKTPPAGKYRQTRKNKQAETQKTGDPSFFHGKFLFIRNVLAKEDFSSKTIGSVRTSDAKLFLIKLQEDGKGYSTIKQV